MKTAMVVGLAFLSVTAGSCSLPPAHDTVRHEQHEEMDYARARGVEHEQQASACGEPLEVAAGVSWADGRLGLSLAAERIVSLGGLTAGAGARIQGIAVGCGAVAKNKIEERSKEKATGNVEPLP